MSEPSIERPGPAVLGWPNAALAGLASSMRSMSGPALLAARGRIPAPARYAVLIAGIGELVADKTRFAPDRTNPSALGGRIAVGAFMGREIAGLAGVASGAAAAAGGTFVTYRARKLVVGRTGLPDPVVAVGEDMIAYVLSAVATRKSSAPRAPGDVNARRRA